MTGTGNLGPNPIGVRGGAGEGGNRGQGGAGGPDAA